MIGKHLKTKLSSKHNMLTRYNAAQAFTAGRWGIYSKDVHV